MNKTEARREAMKAYNAANEAHSHLFHGGPPPTTAAGVAHMLIGMDREMAMSGIDNAAKRAETLFNAAHSNEDEPVDVSTLADADLERYIAEREQLIATISANGLEGAGAARNERRLTEAEDSLAALKAEQIRRNETPAQRDAQRIRASTRRADPNQPQQLQATQAGAGSRGILLDPTTYRNASKALFGARAQTSPWRSDAEWLTHLQNMSGDPRLFQNATGTEGVGVDGGFAVPPTFFGNVLDHAMQEAVFAPRCRLFVSPTNEATISVPDRKNHSAGTAGLIGNWYAEGETMTSQVLRWRELTLKLHKVGILSEVSSELEEDARGYVTELQQGMSEETALTLDAAVYAGTGAKRPLGLMNHKSVITIVKESGQAADTVVFANIVNLYSRLAPRCKKNAVWFVSPGILPQLVHMVFPGSNTPVLMGGGVNDALTGAPAQTIMGRPVIETELTALLGDAGDIVLADMSQYGLLLKPSARFERDAGPGFNRDVLTWRMVMRVGGQPLWDDVVTPRNSGQTLSWATVLGAR